MYPPLVTGLEDQLIVQEGQVTGDRGIFMARLKQSENPQTCLCGERIYKGRQGVATLADLPWGDRPSELWVDYFHWQGGKGHLCRFPQPLAGLQAGLDSSAPEAGKRRRGIKMTQRLLDEVTRRYLQGQSSASLARWCGLSEPTLWRAVTKGLDEEFSRLQATAPERIEGMQHVGIDEIVWQGEIYAVVMNMDSRKLIDLLPDRELETVVRCLEELRTLREQQLGAPWTPVIATDMWEDYRRAVRQVFGDQAKQVTDRFHLQAKVTEALREEGQLLYLQHQEYAATSSGDTEIRDYLSMLTTDYFEFLQSGRVPEPLNYGPFHGDESNIIDLEPLLRLTRQLTQVWNAQTPQEAKDRYLQWRWAYSLYDARRPDLSQWRYRQGRPPLLGFERLIHLYSEWEAEIFSYFEQRHGDQRVTSGPVENMVGQLRRLFSRSQVRSDHRILSVRAIHRLGLNVQSPAPWKFEVRPDLTALPPCKCSEDGGPSDYRLSRPRRSTVQTLPFGGRPTRLLYYHGTARCRRCRQTVTVEAADEVAARTQELEAYVQREWRRGNSQQRVRQETGLSIKRIQAILGPVGQQRRLPPLPRQLGLLRTRWRGQPLWVLTDAKSGRILRLDQPPAGHPPEFLAELHPGQESLCHSLDWSFAPLITARTALDRFSFSQLAYPALGDVIRSYSSTLPLRLQRSKRYRYHRRILQVREGRRPKTDRFRALYLRESESLTRAYQEQQTALQLYEAADTLQFTLELQRWMTSRSVPEDLDEQHRLRQSYRYGHRDVVDEIGHQWAAIVRGFELHREGVSLARSRRELRWLKSLPVWQTRRRNRREALNILEEVCHAR